MHSQSMLFVLLRAARRAVPAGSSTESCSTVPVQPQALIPACSWLWRCGIATVILCSPGSPCLYCTWPRRGTREESCPSCSLHPDRTELPLPRAIQQHLFPASLDEMLAAPLPVTQINAHHLPLCHISHSSTECSSTPPSAAPQQLSTKHLLPQG